MPAIRKQRRRRKSSLVGALSVALSLFASCGGAEKFELTLWTHDFEGSSSINLWLAADGRHATSPSETIGRLLPAPQFGDVGCGDQPYSRRYFSTSGPELKNGAGTYELDLDDGNRLTLDPQTAVDVADGTGVGWTCFHEDGTWRGTAGDLQNRTGTYTLHYDSIETILRLVED